MASLQASHLVMSSSKLNKTYAAISIPRLPRLKTNTKLENATKLVIEELKLRPDGLINNIPITQKTPSTNNCSATNKAIEKMYAVLEAVSDRVEMHKNVGEQRDNWNKLLLNSMNMITLTASAMIGVAAATGSTSGAALLALKSSSTLLFIVATGILAIMNTIQPSQLAEEQRNATRLFKQLETQIHNKLLLSLNGGCYITESDVNYAMEQVLALDKAYPLPLLSQMIEKFPKQYKPSTWWPKKSPSSSRLKTERTQESRIKQSTTWTAELEHEMREVVRVIQNKDSEEYMRLGNMVLKMNKILAKTGPLFAGVAAIGSAFVGTNFGSIWAPIMALTASALATATTILEHGGQVGMVFEMYRNCGGCFSRLEYSIESELLLDEHERQDGEVFEMKVALQLGRSLSDLKSLARNSSSSSCSTLIEEIAIDEFASMLF